MPDSTSVLTYFVGNSITVFPWIKSADIRKFDIFRWGHYLKNFKFYVLNVPLFCEKGGILFKGGHYIREDII